jgi:phosphoserine phosphatase
VFDLDETILTVNSFPLWVRYMIAGKFALSPVDRASLRLRTIMVMLRRKAGLLGHAETKRCLQRLWSAAVAREKDPVALEAVVKQLLATVRPNMPAVLEAVKQNRVPAILATAAAADYAEPLGRALGFAHIVCTPRAGAVDYAENLATTKRDRVMARIADLGLETRRIVFFTDHRDDLPMIKVSDMVLWFGSEEKLAQVRMETPDADIRYCSDAAAEEVLRLAATDA